MKKITLIALVALIGCNHGRFYWHHQAWFALVLFNVLIYIVVAMLVRRHADVTFGLCPTHRRRRNRGILTGVGGVALSIALILAGIAFNVPVVIPIAFLALVIAIVVGITRGRALTPARIDKSGAQFKGCGEAFLASLLGS